MSKASRFLKPKMSVRRNGKTDTPYSGCRDKLYRLLFTGLTGDVHVFRQKMAEKGVRPSIVEQMLNEVPVIIKQNLSLASARKYADALVEMGARIMILDQVGPEDGGETAEPPASMSEFFPCPRCGLVQPWGHVCPRCGLDLIGYGGRGQERVRSDRT